MMVLERLYGGRVPWTLFGVEAPRPRTVLWGGRRGDVVYGGLDWRRRNIVIDPAVQIVACWQTAMFDVGGLVDVVTSLGWDARVESRRIVGFERGSMGLVPA